MWATKSGAILTKGTEDEETSTSGARCRAGSDPSARGTNLPAGAHRHYGPQQRSNLIYPQVLAALAHRNKGLSVKWRLLALH